MATQGVSEKRRGGWLGNKMRGLSGGLWGLQEKNIPRVGGERPKAGGPGRSPSNDLSLLGISAKGG